MKSILAILDKISRLSVPLVEPSVFFILASIVAGSAALAFRLFALVLLSPFSPLVLGFGGWYCLGFHIRPHRCRVQECLYLNSQGLYRPRSVDLC